VVTLRPEVGVGQSKRCSVSFKSTPIGLYAMAQSCKSEAIV
jgi:hypothetical protein